MYVESPNSLEMALSQVTQNTASIGGGLVLDSASVGLLANNIQKKLLLKTNKPSFFWLLEYSLTQNVAGQYPDLYFVASTLPMIQSYVEDPGNISLCCNSEITMSPIFLSLCSKFLFCLFLTCWYLKQLQVIQFVPKDAKKPLVAIVHFILLMNWIPTIPFIHLWTLLARVILPTLTHSALLMVLYYYYYYLVFLTNFSFVFRNRLQS